MSAGAIQLRRLVKRYGSFTAVDGIDLDVEPGTLVSLLGPSGCGKTTTLRMIAGFISPNEGSISVDGELLSDSSSVRPPERRNMGMVFQSYAVWPHMTVTQNIAYGLVARRLGREEIKSRVATMVDLVGLSGQEAKFPSALSGGQQQRVALARAVITQPRILLLDEPLSNLDAKLRETMRHELRRIQQTLGITTVFVTHSQEEALAMSDLIAVMREGRIIEQGTPLRLYATPATRFVADFIGLANFIRGEVECVEGNAARLRTPLGPLDCIWGGGAGRKATLLIRPQHLEIEPGGKGLLGRNEVEAQILEAAFNGSIVDYTLACGSARKLRAQAFAPQRFSTGDQVRVRIPAAHARTVADEESAGDGGESI